MEKESPNSAGRTYISPKHTCPEPELVAGLRARDYRYQTYLFEHYKDALFGDLLFRFAVLENDVESVMVESFMKVYEKIDSYSEERGKLFTWIVNISRNTAIDQVRTINSKSVKRTSLGIDEKYEQIGDGCQQADPNLNEFAKWVIKRCNDVEKQILQLYYYEGLHHPEIAKALDIPLGTVKTKLRNIMIRIRRKIEEEKIDI